MSDLSSLHCPNCGALAAPSATQCPYCQARLAAVACPSCFEMMFDGTNYCPHCGARRDRHVSDADAGPCPGCGGALEAVAIGTTSLLDCAKCDGAWLDAEAFERLCADREAQAAVLHRGSEVRAGTSTAVRYRPCVRCGKLMNRINFGKASGVIVDVCRGHGTFLDRGELHRIVTFIQAGGLDRMREREREDMHDEERRLRSEQAGTAGMVPLDLEGSAGWDGHAFRQFISSLFER